VKDFVGAKIVGQTKDGKNIYEGPRGGHFYYNDKGDKVYVKKP
jgi:colicin import membrane protein